MAKPKSYYCVWPQWRQEAPIRDLPTAAMTPLPLLRVSAFGVLVELE